MAKNILFNILFLLSFSIAVSAATEESKTEDISINIDYGKEKPKGFSAESTNKTKLNNFSLGSKMQFKGEKVINNKINYINFNTSITYQKGQSSYVVPFKKKVMISSITFNPNELLRNYNK